MGVGMEYRAGLNGREPLADRMALAVSGARRLHVGVAYAKTSGVSQLLRTSPPRGGRAVVGLGFGLTDPLAVEQLESGGFDVRVVPDGTAIAASQFHPKLYLIERPGQLTALSGSANLTGAGWTTNVEQFEELTFPDPSDAADDQRTRYEELWDHGAPLALLRRSGDWERYRQRARDRRLLEREDRRRLTRLQATTGELVGRLARRSTRAAPGYVGITNDDWWELQLHLRDQTDRALFWRRNTKGFRALAVGGVFFHLVKAPGRPEDSRAIEGYSIYPGVYETGLARHLFARYGPLLGVHNLPELYTRLSLEPGSEIGVIHLESLTELDRPVPLLELRANGVEFARNIVSGRSLSLEEVATIFELGGLGMPADVVQAAEEPAEGWS
jgi:HKD family nuclease